MELARGAVRYKIREAGGRLKDYGATDISARARRRVESDPRFMAMAKRQIEDEARL
jgi:hypothetical protein